MATKAQKTAAANGAETVEAAFKDGFEKATKGYEQLIQFGKDTTEAMLKAAAAAGKGIETINTEVFSYSRQSVEDGVSASKALLASRTVQELMEVQADFTKAAFEGYMSELGKVRDLALDTAKAVSEPIQARMAAFADLVQAKAA